MSDRTVVQVRLSEAEKARWREQAGERSLSDYLRFLVEEDAKPRRVSVPVFRAVMPGSTSEDRRRDTVRPAQPSFDLGFKPDFKPGTGASAKRGKKS